MERDQRTASTIDHLAGTKPGLEALGLRLRDRHLINLRHGDTLWPPTVGRQCQDVRILRLARPIASLAVFSKNSRCAFVKRQSLANQVQCEVLGNGLVRGHILRDVLLHMRQSMLTHLGHALRPRPGHLVLFILEQLPGLAHLGVLMVNRTGLHQRVVKIAVLGAHEPCMDMALATAISPDTARVVAIPAISSCIHAQAGRRHDDLVH